jgi:hypothetical protein
LIEPNPQDWGERVSYLLEQMEAEVKRGMKGAYYNAEIIAAGPW